MKPGDEFEVLTATGGIEGTFTNATYPLLSNFLTFDLDYDEMTVTLCVTLVTADFDGDGDIDNEDFDIWQMGLGTVPAIQSDGDADGDMDVDGDDYLILQQQFGMTTAQLRAAVPEPSCVVLLVTAMLMALRGLRR